MPQLVLTDLERRVIANLAQPRNVPDLAYMLRTDPYTPFGGRPLDELSTEAELDKFLRETLLPAGLVTEVKEEEPLKVALAVERGDGLTMPDDKANLYVERLAADHRQWRTVGPKWMLRETDGLDMLRAPVGPDAPLTRTQLATMISKHFEAIKQLKFEGSIHDEDGGRLAPTSRASLASGVVLDGDAMPTATMLPEEFNYWLDKVISGWEAATGEKYPRPIMGGAGYANATEDLIQAADAGGTAYSETSPTYMALSILAFGDTDTGTTADDGSHIPTYTGYARKSATNTDMGTSSAGTRTNANAIVFAGASAGSSTIVGAARCVAATVGRMIRYMTVASTVVSSTQTPAQFAAGAITDTLD